MQASRCGDDAWNRVDNDGGGCDVAMDAAFDHEVDVGFARDDNAVVWLELADGGLEFKMDHGEFVAKGTRDLANASDFAAMDLADATNHVAISLDGNDVFFPALEGNTQIMPEEMETFAKADVAKRALFDFGRETSVIKASADLSLERNATH